MPQLGRYDRELGAMNLTQRLPDCFPLCRPTETNGLPKIRMWYSHRTCGIRMWHSTAGRGGESKFNLLQGTLDPMVLQTLAVMGALHGYGIARRIEQISGNEILRNQGPSTPPSCACSSEGGFQRSGRF